MSNITRTSYAFVVKEDSDGTPWIVLEPRNEQPLALKRGVLGFDLQKDTSYNKAQEVADFLNNNLGELIYTPFE